MLVVIKQIIKKFLILISDRSIKQKYINRLGQINKAKLALDPMQKAKKIADSNIDFLKKKKPIAKNNNAKGQSMVFVLSISKIELEKANKINKNLFFSTKTLAIQKIDKQKKVKLKMLEAITPKLQDTKPRTASGIGCP